MNANGGTVNGSNTINLVTEGQRLVSLPEATRTGYRFLGWYDAPTGGNRVSTGTLFNADSTIYAQWKSSEPVNPGEPSTPSNSHDDSIDMEGKTLYTNRRVDVDEEAVDRDVREILGRDNIIVAAQVEESNEPVEVTVEAGREYRNETVYVVQKNVEDELVLVAVVEADSRGDIVFVTESSEELILTTYLPEGFIDDIEENTYYINEDVELVKGWLELDGWYFFDYETGIQQKGRWVAEYTDWYCLDANGRMFTSTWIARDSKLDVWYYVTEDGLMLTNTTTPDGFYVDAEGIWRA